MDARVSHHNCGAIRETDAAFIAPVDTRFDVIIRDAVNLSRMQGLSLALVTMPVEGSPHLYATGRG